MPQCKKNILSSVGVARRRSRSTTRLASVASIILCFLLVACEQMGLAEVRSFPPFPRGVAEGVAFGPRDLDSLREHGIILADSGQGTSVILQADRVFIEQVDRVVINPDFQPALNELAHVLKGYPAMKLSVVGHTDGVMSRDLQAKQSDAYAQAVANYLMSAGVSGTRFIAVRGVSDRQPIVDDYHDKFVERQVNRRVEVVTAQPLH